jgi:hypothetical protein
MVEYVVKEKGIKTVSQLRERLFNTLTKGYAFRYEKMSEYEAARERARAEVDQMIRDNMHLIPAKIKRDIEL